MSRFPLPSTPNAQTVWPHTTSYLPTAYCHLPEKNFHQKFCSTRTFVLTEISFPTVYFGRHFFTVKKPTKVCPKVPTVAAESCSSLQELEKSRPAIFLLSLIVSNHSKLQLYVYVFDVLLESKM